MPVFFMEIWVYIQKLETQSLLRMEKGLYVAILPFQQSLLRMMRAAITPGTHPARVSRKTMSIEPHPLSITASGGKSIDNSTPF